MHFTVFLNKDDDGDNFKEDSFVQLTTAGTMMSTN